MDLMSDSKHLMEIGIGVINDYILKESSPQISFLKFSKDSKGKLKIDVISYKEDNTVFVKKENIDMLEIFFEDELITFANKAAKKLSSDGKGLESKIEEISRQIAENMETGTAVVLMTGEEIKKGETAKPEAYLINDVKGEILDMERFEKINFDLSDLNL